MALVGDGITHTNRLRRCVGVCLTPYSATASASLSACRSAFAETTAQTLSEWRPIKESTAAAIDPPTQSPTVMRGWCRLVDGSPPHRHPTEPPRHGGPHPTRTHTRLVGPYDDNRRLPGPPPVGFAAIKPRILLGLVVRRWRLRVEATPLRVALRWGPVRGGVCRKSTTATRAVAVLRCARSRPRTTPAIAGGKRPGTARGKGTATAVAEDGFSHYWRLADARPRVALRPYRQGWVFSAYVKAGPPLAVILSHPRRISLDTAPKTLHIVVRCTAEHKFGKIVLDIEHFFGYYKN